MKTPIAYGKCRKCGEYPEDCECFGNDVVLYLWETHDPRC